MPRSLALVMLLASLLAPAAASAGGDTCFWDASNQFFYRFPKLKIPKKPDSVVPVTGLAASAFSTNYVPVSGGLVRDANTGGLYLGFTRFFDRCLAAAVLADDLSGTISYDCNLDDVNDGTYTLSFLPDCVVKP